MCLQPGETNHAVTSINTNIRSFLYQPEHETGLAWPRLSEPDKKFLDDWIRALMQPLPVNSLLHVRTVTVKFVVSAAL